MVADECHWGPVKGSQHDKFVNDPDLCSAPNFLLLLVSATPYNVLTCNSRIDQRPTNNNVVKWFKPGEEAESEYRSMRFYIDTIAFDMPPNLEAKMRYKMPPEDSYTEISLSLEDPAAIGPSSNAPLRFGDFTALAKMLTRSLDAKIGKGKLRVRYDGTLDRFCIETPKPNKLKGPVIQLIDCAGANSIWSSLGFDDQTSEPITTKAPSVYASRPTSIDEKAPLELQRIRRDEQFRNLHLEFTKKFVSSRSKKPEKLAGVRAVEQAGTASGKAFHYQDGHLIVCDYLFSLVYFATFRLDDNWLLLDDAATRLKLHDAELTGIGPNSFRSKLRAVCEKTTGRLQYNLNSLMDIFCAEKLKKAKELVLVDGDVGSSVDDRCWALYGALMLKKRYEEELCAQTTTEDQDWFSMTDRIVKSLLDQPRVKGCTHGKMVFLRVYDNDENLCLQTILRTALEELRLANHSRRVFCVVSDIGGTKLYSHIERCFLDYDLRRPVQLDDTGEISLVDAKGKPVVDENGTPTKYSLRTIFDERKKELSNGQDAELRYEDLYNLPCLVIVRQFPI